MATYRYEVATDLQYENLTIYRRYVDDVHSGYRLNANEGYVFYDSSAEDFAPDPDTGVLKPVVYYSTLAYLPLNYNFDNFSYVAVSRDSVDENYIFGNVTPPSEKI